LQYHMSRLSIVTILSIVAFVSADYNVIEGILKLQPFILKSSQHCPVPLIGHACPKGDELTYFKCCGELNKDCCETFQDWVFVLFAFFLVLFLIAFCICCVRC
ncbi:hypothetical protein PMAYCL1PPCAC_28345, partial [Pristionchus mayeri]